MQAKIIDGRALSQDISQGIQERVTALRQRGIAPKLAVILVGNNPASEVYVQNKEKKAKQLGITVEIDHRDADITEDELIHMIGRLNRDASVHGILVQLPLPEGMDATRVLSYIDPAKDVDGLHTFNAGALLTGREGFIACTPKGVIELIKSAGVPIRGKNAVVVGRSNLVGKPTAIMMLRNDATVTLCHSKTENLGDITRGADILISAVGKPNLITADMIKDGAVVIDIGQSKVGGKWRGDVDFENACEVASYITPVPGGVGPMTITMLMDNTVEAAERQTHGE